MTRTRPSFKLAALTLCAACALLQTGSAARADLNITTFPYTISGNVKDNVIIYNLNNVTPAIVTIAPGASITGNVTMWNSAITVAPTASITGNVTMWNNSSMKSGGQVGGTVTAHDTSYVGVTGGSLGNLSL